MSKDLDLGSLRDLMKFRPSLRDTASFYNVSEDTISRKIREFENLTFKEFRIKHSYSVKINLINKALELADKGNVTALIFCLKNYCDWSDKPEKSDDKKLEVIPINYIPKSLRK